MDSSILTELDKIDPKNISKADVQETIISLFTIIEKLALENRFLHEENQQRIQIGEKKETEEDTLHVIFRLIYFIFLDKLAQSANILYKLLLALFDAHVPW